jgi:arylsulfate sulfotransferase
VTFPTFTVQQPPGPGTDLTQDTVMHFGVAGVGGLIDTVATDLAGNIDWYYDSVANNFPSFATTLVPGGMVYLIGGQLLGAAEANTLREIDLAGDIVRETNVDAVNAELAAAGQHPISDFNHDAQLLPNGDTAVISTTSRTIRVGGKSVLYNGDMVVVLNQNFQVAWVWDAFNYLNIHRLPILGQGPSDWLHANSVDYSPADGDLIVSLRHQDWAIKIDYANGTGDGHVIWRLGQGGNFKLNALGASPWFSYQHDVTYVNDNTIVLFDNGDVRRSHNKHADSRGQEWIINEKTRVATLVVNVDLGNYASYTGSAQMLPNGTLNFDSPLAEQNIEVLADGSKTYVLKMNMPGLQYRSYIYSTLYGDPAGTSLPSTPIPPRLARRLAILDRQAERRQQRRARQ